MTLVPATAPPDLVKYRLLDEIGHGGMATVYRALDLRLGREVAVKLIHPHLRENLEAAARFVTEARAVAKLHHPGIVEIYDISDEGDDERYLVSQLIRGPSLRKLLRDRGALPPEIGACIGVLLCDALAHAHDANVVHRDVKPENVLMELDDARRTASVKLTDFGIAKLIDAQGVTSTGQVLGSPAHMAPEQIEGGPIDVRADIFGVGVLLYECVVGHLPFEGKNPAQVLRRVLDGSYAAADKERPQVGNRWAAVIARAIARTPSERYQDVRDLAAEIRANLGQVGIEEPLAEVYRYLEDPGAYELQLGPKLVSTLVARAERARAAGDIQSAAGDLNRAVAYAPDDVDLLRRVNALARGARRKRVLRQSLAILVPFALLSVGTYGLVTAIRSRPAAPARGIGLASAAVAMPESSAEPEIVADTSAVALTDDAPEAGVAPNGSRTIMVPKLRLPSEFRAVHIRANVGSALVSIDGAPPVPLSFTYKTTLHPGMHKLVFSVEKGNPCCESLVMPVEIKEVPPDDAPQVILARLVFRDARLTLSGGPSDGTMTCPAVSATVRSGGTVAVKMSDSLVQLHCFLKGSGGGGGEETVNLKAGEPYVVRWPEP